MKIRNGFVSNSSSSSFILVYDPSLNIDHSFFLTLLDTSNIKSSIMKKVSEVLARDMSIKFHDAIRRHEETIEIKDYMSPDDPKVKEAIDKKWSAVVLRFHSEDESVMHDLIEEMGNEFIEGDKFLIQF